MKVLVAAELAEVLGAPPPRRLPLALVRIAAGAWGAAYLGRLRGADNSRAPGDCSAGGLGTGHGEPSWPPTRSG